jgi:hypothetical protein
MQNDSGALPRDGRGVRAGIALTVLLSCWGSFQYFRLESDYQQQFSDPYRIAAQFSRLEGVQSAVPETAILGYFTDLEITSVAAGAMFGGAQYVLAPRILRRGTEFDRVLGNFARPGDFGAMGRAQGLDLERDFGNGVVLFRRESR